MAINNLNPRRTVWFSPYEPSNKYDIWLSKNAHYDENGEPTTDSNSQRDCDYIFKVYDCGKWQPIVGFNSTAKFKINTVANTEYEYTYNGTRYISNSIQQFHLPLFRNPDDSPAELFDAGTIGEAILQFVSETDWKNIFEGDSFYNAFEWYLEEENIIELLRATPDELGGIKATSFRSLIPQNELAEASFNDLNPDTHNDRLYVWAKDIVDAINTYIVDNPDAPGIQPSNDFELWLATTVKTGGIRADTHIGTNGFKPIECKYYPNQTSQSQYYGRLSVSVEDIIDGIDEYFDLDQEGGNDFAYNLFVDTRSISRRVYAEEYVGQNHNVGFEIWGGGNEQNAGKVLRLKEKEYWPINPEYTMNNNSISWVECEDIVKDGTNYDNSLQPLVLQCTNGSFSWVTMPSSPSSQYDVLSQSDHVDTKNYVIKGPNLALLEPAKDYILNSNGEWTKVLHGNGITNNITLSEIKISANIQEKSDNTGWDYNNVVTISKASGNDYITIDGDDNQSLNVYEFQWLQIDSLSVINFDSTLSLYKSGNPIYIYIINNIPKFVFMSNVLYRANNDLNNYSAVLITIQFGIVKVEGCNIGSGTPQ